MGIGNSGDWHGRTGNLHCVNGGDGSAMFFRTVGRRVRLRALSNRDILVLQDGTVVDRSVVHSNCTDGSESDFSFFLPLTQAHGHLLMTELDF